jgi:putative ABC transport system permease protein
MLSSSARAASIRNRRLDGIVTAKRVAAQRGMEWFAILLRQASDCFGVAAANLLQLRMRFVIAVAGTAMPILLLLLQLALVQAVRTEVTRLYSDFDFDLVLVPVSYEYMNSSGVFDSVRLAQARAIEGVADTFSLNVSGGAWTGNDLRRSPILVAGIDDKSKFIADPQIRDGIAGLRTGNEVLVDRYSGTSLGPLVPGTTARLDDRPVIIAGQFSLGMFFYASGAAIIRNVNLPQLTGDSSGGVSFGLIAVSPGFDPEIVRRKLVQALPPDVRVLSRRELFDDEQRFFLSTKPFGIMVEVGMIVAFLAGAVILWQVLSAEIMRRLGEFATLAAMGYGASFILGVGFCETFLLGFVAFLPAAVLGGVILEGLELTTHLPVWPDFGLWLELLGIVLLMCALCGISVAQRIARAQPASLF